MQFILKAFQQLDGLGAASGLIYQHDHLYLISDYSSYLYCYELEQGQLNKIALFADSCEFLPKAEKFDFEAIVAHDNSLLLFGSGSTARRNILIRYNLAGLQNNEITNNTVAQTYDLSTLYQSFKDTARLADDELNIEGVLNYQGQWLFFQRGNGIQAQNGIFVVQGDIFQPKSSADNQQLDIHQPLLFVPIQLPLINQVMSSFTDAIQVGQMIYFLATAENSQSTYLDGEVLGSYIGCMDITSKAICDVQLISTCHKFEGLTLYHQSPHLIEFLLCEDNDTEQLNTTIYKLSLSIE